MANRNHETIRYLILIKDLCVGRNRAYGSTSKVPDGTAGLSEYLKGTILEEIPISPPTAKLTCIVIDSKEIIECDENDVDPLTVGIKDLLIAISNCKERYEVFKNKQRLSDGLEMNPGCEVIVRLPTISDVLGKLRFKGKLVDREGTYFGIELIQARNKGNSNGTMNKIRYFECPEDCGVFLALNRVTSKSYHNLMVVPVPAPRKTKIQKGKTNGSSSTYSPSMQGPMSGMTSVPTPSVINISDDELQDLNIHIGMEVYIFTEVSGVESQERGTVRFLGRMPGELPTNDIYVGIELVNPSGNGRGVFNRRQLFKTKLNHAALVPLSGVLPASTFDESTPREIASSQPMEEYVPMFGRSQPKLPSSHTAFTPTGGRQQREDYLDQVTRRQPQQHQFESQFGQRNHFSRSEGGTVIEPEDDIITDIYSGQSIVDPERFYPSHTTNYTQQSVPQSRPVLSPADCPEFEIDTMVEIMDGIESGTEVLVGPIFGVVKWIGLLPDTGHIRYAGIELEIERDELTDGTYNGRRYFQCGNRRALFVPTYSCQKDSRFSHPDDFNSKSSITQISKTKNFGNFEAPRIKGCMEPPRKLSEDMLGKGKGIQGHHNSCYLDSMLFSLFAFSHCLDSILLRPKREEDLPEYQQVQEVLKEEIVNPLRTRHFVRADKIMQLRRLLDPLSSVTGLTHEEKDPEEFLQTLLNHVFKADPLVELRQGNSNHTQECHFYQIFTDKDDKMVLPTTQLLLEQSFLTSDLKFREVPVCLILQMPRFGKDFKMYNRVRPSLTLDVTDMVERLPRNCSVCGGLAEYECKQCSVERTMQENISSYCANCATICHQHPMRKKHSYKKIDLPDEYRSFIAEEGPRPAERHKLDLYAVVCIETSHYVSFAKCGKGRNTKWCFFDSMADRVGEQNGYNIPQVTVCDEFEDWLKMDTNRLLEIEQRLMPEFMRRLLCDAYLCLYQSEEMMFYT